MILLRGPSRFVFLILASLMMVSVAGGQSIPEADQQSPALSKELEAEAKAIENLLIAPCCWTQPVSEHYSGASWEIRNNVRKMLADGKTRQQIVDFYVQEYGKRILSAPETAGFNSLAYTLPLLFLIAGIPLVLWVVRKLRTQSAPIDAPRSAVKIDPRYAKLLEKELQD